MSGPEPSTGSRGLRPNILGPTVLTLAVLAVFLYFIRLILIPFVAAAALAYILSIVVDFLTRKTRISRTAVAAAVFVTLIVIIGGIAYFAYPSISSEGFGFITDLKGSLTKAINELTQGQEVHLLGRTYKPEQLAGEVQNMVVEWISQPSHLLTVAGTGFSTIFAAFLTAILLLYFLLGGSKIVSSLIGLAPPAQRPLIGEIVHRVNPVLRRYFAGVGIIVTYAGIASYIGLGLILGLKHAVILAMATAFLEMIPVVGPFLAALLAGLVALQSATSIWGIFKYVIYATVLRLSIDQLFGPLVLGRAASLSPVTVIFCFLAGGILYGIVGVVMAVPVALALRITLKTIYGEMEEA